MSAPLDGIRVVEIASFVAVPAAGTLLADLGAEVVKVEVPGGELMRLSRPSLQGFKSDFDAAPQFEMENRGKRSLVMDLARPPARAALERVINGADVVLTNLLPERRRRFGLDPETLRASRPRLIYAGLNGFGPEGPDADEPAFDYTAYWARTGLMDLMREVDAVPVWLRPGVGDHTAALALVVGILAALRVREETGVGQEVDTSLLQIGMYVAGNDLSQSLVTGQRPPYFDRRQPRNPLWNTYRTADDRWLFLVMIDSVRYWPKLTAAIGRADLEIDPRFADAVARYRNSRELVAELDDVFASRSLEEWEHVLADGGIIWSPVRHMHELLADPQVRAMGYVMPVEHPRLGRFETVAPPVRLGGHTVREGRPAPELGADSAEILREAGLSETEIARALEVDD